MQLTAPGPLWYTAKLIGASQDPSSIMAVGHFQVFDAAGTPHNGLGVDGQTVQQYLDVAIDAGHLPNIRQSVIEALQNLILAEYGGELGAVIGAAIQQGVIWQ
ncbi:MAG TPA: hypothetical protein VG273_11845 [Bryobacteraceae bacterium]|nr:hypothetical protein [Bryobacteraceae bacterium]